MVLLAETKPKQYSTYEDFPVEDLLTYAGLDCIATSGVMSKTWPTISAEVPYIQVKEGTKKQQRLMSIAESMENYTMPFHEFICDMEINGILYDTNKNREIARRMTADLLEVEGSLYSETRGVDLDSGKALGDFLYNVKGFTPPYKTKHGDPSTDGEALKQLAKSTGLSWLADIGKRNDIASTYRTFIRDYIEEHVKRDGRIHPSYNLNGTSSFRITGDNPNLTQLPRPKHGYNIRECFRVADGNVFLAFDFSSAEVKVLGALCRDPNLLRAIREGLDFHSYSASAMHGIPYEDFVAILKDETHPLRNKYKEMRQVAKVLTFSILYGSTANGVAMQLGLTVEKASELIAMYFRAYPGIETFIKDAHEMAMLNNFIMTPFNQRKWEFGTRKEFKYTAAFNACKRNAQNVLIQSTTSTLGLYCFTHLNEKIKALGGKSLCTVYDSIEIEIPVERAAEAIEAAYYYMNDFPQKKFDWLDFPIGVDGEIGYNWGELESAPRGITQEQILELV